MKNMAVTGCNCWRRLWSTLCTSSRKLCTLLCWKDQIRCHLQVIVLKRKKALALIRDTMLDHLFNKASKT